MGTISCIVIDKDMAATETGGIYKVHHTVEST